MSDVRKYYLQLICSDLVEGSDAGADCTDCAREELEQVEEEEGLLVLVLKIAGLGEMDSTVSPRMKERWL